MGGEWQRVEAGGGGGGRAFLLTSTIHMQWGALCLDEGAKSEAGSNTAARRWTQTGLVPHSILSLVRRTHLPQHRTRARTTGKSAAGTPASSRASTAATNTRRAHTRSSRTPSFASVSERGRSRPSTGGPHRHGPNMHPHSQSRYGSMLRKASNLKLVDTKTGAEYDDEKVGVPDSSSSSEEDLPEIRAIRAQQKEGMALGKSRGSSRGKPSNQAEVHCRIRPQLFAVHQPLTWFVLPGAGRMQTSSAAALGYKSSQATSPSQVPTAPRHY